MNKFDFFGKKVKLEDDIYPSGDSGFQYALQKGTAFSFFVFLIDDSGNEIIIYQALKDHPDRIRQIEKNRKTEWKFPESHKTLRLTFGKYRKYETDFRYIKVGVKFFSYYFWIIDLKNPKNFLDFSYSRVFLNDDRVSSLNPSSLFNEMMLCNFRANGKILSIEEMENVLPSERVSYIRNMEEPVWKDDLIQISKPLVSANTENNRIVRVNTDNFDLISGKENEVVQTEKKNYNDLYDWLK